MEMNENEIITALECCISEEVQGCIDCPLLEFSRDCEECRTELMKQALDIIRRKNAEVEELQSELIITKNNFDNVKDEYDEAVRIGQRMHEKLVDAYKKLQTAKSEGRREFAERLKKKAASRSYCTILESDVDEVLAEMESERG